MARVFITGSADGLGLAAARTLLDEGHEVVLHARNRKRAAVLSDLAPRAQGVVIGDLGSAAETRALADQVNALGRMDAVIHNAGVYLESARGKYARGPRADPGRERPRSLPADGVDRASGPPDLLQQRDAPRRRRTRSTTSTGPERRWNASKAYSESKLYLTAFALTVARRWPDVLSNAVDPGWVPTKMGGPGATDDLEQGHLTQTWLAVSEDPAAKVSGGYWHHRKRTDPGGGGPGPGLPGESPRETQGADRGSSPLATRRDSGPVAAPV